jgi:hypothetical protein
MSLPEAEDARARAKKSNYNYCLDAPLSTTHPNQVLTFVQWCRLNNISERTGRRILKSDNGPVMTQLGSWRSGITVANNAKWQASRERASNDTQPRGRGRQRGRTPASVPAVLKNDSAE